MGCWHESRPEELVLALRRLGSGRAWLARHEDGWRSSDPALADLAAWLQESPDQDGHEAVFLQASHLTDALFVAVLHRTARGPAQGGLRRWRYDCVGDVLRDGLRLSRGMTRKAALAGLWWGGGKGLIARAPGEADVTDPILRHALYREYGSFVSSLCGAYVTAEDAGTGPDDVAALFETTRFCTCVPVACGGSGDPSPDTARGVVCGMEAALQAGGLGGLAGHRIALQGVGRVGAAMVDRLLEHDVAEVVAVDASAERVRELGGRWDGAPVHLRHAPPGDDAILSEPCDVLAPTALGGVLGPDTIPQLKARVVCGAANNPLVDEERDGAALCARGIVYVPDYVVNRMGIVRCADEHMGRLSPDPAVERHLDPDAPQGIPAVVRRLLRAAADEGLPTPVVAAREAERLAREPHPIHGLRTRAVVEALLRRWHEG